MSSTNKTTYYDLPQFVDSDLFNPLVDDNDAYDKIDTALHNIAEAEAGDASEIVGVKARVTTAEGKIEALETQNGVEALTTTAQTLSGAVNELDADVASVNDRLDVVDDDINNANTGLKTKVDSLGTRMTTAEGDIDALEAQNGSDTLTTTAQTLSGAINELKNKDDDILSDISNITSDIEQLDDTIIKMAGKPCIGSLLLNHFYDFSQFAYSSQGACYIGNDKIVQYYNNINDNDGYLICFNLKTWTEEWRYLLNCYHGNSITYNPNTEMLYISGCVTHDNTYVNMIFEIDINNPSVINRTITLPNATMNYTLAYDIDKNVFYAINSIGSTAGVSDILTVYDSTLTSVIREIQLENYPSVKRSESTQGCQLGINGIAYILVYSNPAYIVGYDTITGKQVQFFNLPRLINDYRSYDEAEALMYDYVNNRMFVSARGAGKDIAIRSYLCVNIFEIDAFHGIPYYEAKPSLANNLEGNAYVFFVHMKVSTLKPLHLNSPNTLNTMQDGINLAYKYQGCRLQLSPSAEIDEIYNLHCSGVNARIQADSNHVIKINKLNCINSKLYIQYAEFMDNDEWISGNYTQLALTNCDAFLANCTFKDNNPNSLTSISHITLFNGSNLMSRSITFQGTYPTIVKQYYSMYNGVYVET